MPRVSKGAARTRKHKKVLKQARGFYGANSRRYQIATEKVFRAGVFATRDRRNRKLVGYLKYSAAGSQLFVAVGLGALLGWWLDGKTGWSPILLIAGDPAKGVVTPEDAQQMAGLWREGKVVQIDGVGHMIHNHALGPFVEAVQAFLAEI